jgi:hypothetical protein
MVDPRDRDEPVPEGETTGTRERAETTREPTAPPTSREPMRDPRDRDDLPEGLRRRLEAMIPEIVKKTFSAGMGAVFSTEEGIRRIAKDINIPDVAGYIANTADTTKDRVLEIVASEVRNFLQTMNFTEEIAKLLTTLSFEIKTEIRFIPNSEKYTGVEPDVKASAKLKRTPTPDPEKQAEEKRGRRFWRRDEDSDPEPDGER